MIGYGYLSIDLQDFTKHIALEIVRWWNQGSNTNLLGHDVAYNNLPVGKSNLIVWNG